MRKITLAIIAMLIFGCVPPGFSEWNIGFDKGNDQVGLIAPVGAEDVPVGPSSYRLLGDSLWLLDSAKGRVLNFDSSNALTKEIKIPGLLKGAILADFALQIKDGLPQAIIVLDTMNHQIIKFSLDGKELLRVKADKLIQLDEIDIDSNGQFYVGDFGKADITVFSGEGKVLRTIPWQWSGFAVDKDNNLHMMNFQEKIGHAHVKIAADGKELARTELGMPDVQNPRIWNVNDKGDVLISVVPPDGDSNNQLLYTFSAEGDILNKAVFKNPYYINRYLLAGSDSAWLVNADYGSKEPKIKISPLK